MTVIVRPSIVTLNPVLPYCFHQSLVASKLLHINLGDRGESVHDLLIRGKEPGGDARLGSACPERAQPHPAFQVAAHQKAHVDRTPSPTLSVRAMTQQIKAIEPSSSDHRPAKSQLRRERYRCSPEFAVRWAVAFVRCQERQIIDQAQILTTHNLAVLFDASSLHERLSRHSARSLRPAFGGRSGACALARPAGIRSS
jgi:hypothetical protein